MRPIDRRCFLHGSMDVGLGLAAGAAVLNSTPSARAVSANEKLVIGVMGLRGRGASLAQDFARRPDCEVAYLADVDSTFLPQRAQEVASIQGHEPRTVQDFRRMLDDPVVDVIVNATPDHWHALGAILACQAGKHVYTEKPASHSPWEGRRMVEAARKYDRIVQVGLQNRSAPYNHAAKDYIASGKLGSIHMVRVHNQKEWPNRPEVPDASPPPSLDWDMWCGPAPYTAYNENYHNSWNHFWRYSGGDIINDGVHQMDLARWLIDRDYPKSVYCVGGRYAQPGVLETPDTQVAVFEFDNLVLTFENTLYTPYMIKSDPEVRNRPDLFPYWPQNAERIEIYGSDGVMYVGRHGCGWQVYARPQQRKPVLFAQMHGTFPDPEHKENFIQAIRNRTLPSADIEQGHRSTLMCQIANISLRVGGQRLELDSSTERFTNNESANALLRREYRSPWIVPDVV